VDNSPTLDPLQRVLGLVTIGGHDDDGIAVQCLDAVLGDRHGAVGTTHRGQLPIARAQMMYCWVGYRLDLAWR
jgi:hypothetical protein